MSMPRGEGMAEEPAKPEGVAVEPLEAIDERTAETIRALGLNALDKEEINPSFDELGNDMHNLREHYLNAGSRGAMFVAREGERIVGFLALTKAGRTATVTQLRYASGERGDELIGDLLKAAIGSVRGVCDKIVIEAGMPRRALKLFCEMNDFSSSPAEGEKVHLEKSLTA